MLLSMPAQRVALVQIDASQQAPALAMHDVPGVDDIDGAGQVWAI